MTNLLTTSLTKKMMLLLQKIGETAQKSGCDAYAVGGFVRDLLRRTPNSDLDIVIEGDGITFAQELAKLMAGEVRSHEKFKTAVVKLQDGFKIDVATARLEYYEYPAARPIIELSSIKLDLFRRDFTMNALAIHLNPDQFGILVDFFNCQNDIRDKQIRVLHNLSFIEDPTRIFRAIRFEQRMGFTLGKLTEKLMKNAVKIDLFNRFSGSRFFHELRMILSEENPLPAIYRLNHFSLLQFLHPSLKLTQRLKNILRETHRSVAWYRLLYLEEPCREWLVFLLALLAKLTTRQLIVLCQKIEVPERYLHFMVKEKSACTRILKVLNQRAMDLDLDGTELPGPLSRRKSKKTSGQALRLSEVYLLLQGLSPEGLLYLMGTTSKKSGKMAVSIYVTKLRYIKTDTLGNDLKELGYTPGPIFKTILNHLLEAKLDGLLLNKQDELEFIKKHYGH